MNSIFPSLKPPFSQAKSPRFQHLKPSVTRFAPLLVQHFTSRGADRDFPWRGAMSAHGDLLKWIKCGWMSRDLHFKYPAWDLHTKSDWKWPYGHRNSGFTDLPSYKMVMLLMFHSFLYVYQRVERNVDLPMTHWCFLWDRNEGTYYGGYIKQSVLCVFYEEDAWENHGRIFHGLGFEHQVGMRWGFNRPKDSNRYDLPSGNGWHSYWKWPIYSWFTY